MINIAIIDDDKTFCDDFEEQIKKIDNSYNKNSYNTEVNLYQNTGNKIIYQTIKKKK